MAFARRAHIALCWLYLVLLPVQFLLAGIGVMGGDIEQHMMFGGLILHLALPVLMLITAGIGRMGWSQAGWPVLLFAILTLQITVVDLGRDMGAMWVAGLHPVISFLTWPFVYFVMLRGARAKALSIAGTASEPPPAASAA